MGLWECNELMHLKGLAQWLTHGKSSLSDCSYGYCDDRPNLLLVGGGNAVTEP